MSKWSTRGSEAGAVTPSKYLAEAEAELEDQFGAYDAEPKCRNRAATARTNPTPDGRSGGTPYPC